MNAQPSLARRGVRRGLAERAFVLALALGASLLLPACRDECAHGAPPSDDCCQPNYNSCRTSDDCCSGRCTYIGGQLGVCQIDD